MPKLNLASVRTLWPDTEFVALDFETTGLNCRFDRIVEIGALRFNGVGEISSLSLLVDPGMPISPGASRVNGITNAMVRGKQPCDKALPELLEFIGKALVVAHNAPFDIGFLKEALKRIGKRRFTNKIADTRLIAREAFPGLPSYALQNLARFLAIPPSSAHRALDDARVCKDILARAVAQI
ncbi:MAG: 3'-5' exonuclease [Spirochaetes bacterium]|nr:3'-5' exonuclease [Spirochaetota bacterium]